MKSKPKKDIDNIIDFLATKQTKEQQMMEEMDRLHDRICNPTIQTLLEDFVIGFNNLPGCSAHTCSVRTNKKGQHTNGGCTCLNDIPDITLRILILKLVSKLGKT